jgi:hypothetical protein
MLFNDVSILYNISKEMVKDFSYRIKSWSILTCVGDVFNTFISNVQIYINYANNYEFLISTLDNLLMSNPKFRSYMLQIEKNNSTNTMTYVTVLYFKKAFKIIF